MMLCLPSYPILHFTRSFSLQGSPGPPGLPGPVGYPGEKVSLLHLASKDCFDGTFAWLNLYYFCPHAGWTWFTRASRSRWAKGLESEQITFFCVCNMDLKKKSLYCLCAGAEGRYGWKRSPWWERREGRDGALWALCKSLTATHLSVQRTKIIFNNCFMLLSVDQGLDGQKGEKGECRIDDNLVRVLHSNITSLQ